jgi:hypothetical protein
MAAIPDSQALTAPPPSKAVIVFMRLSSSACVGLQSSVFDVSVEPPSFVGILAAEQKIAYTTDPGVRHFMAIGNGSMDFMDATLLAGKTYYARVTPHWGVLKGRFSLDPVPKAETEEELDEDLASATWVVNNAASLKWAQNHLPGIEEKYVPLGLTGSEKPTLTADDGR